MYLLFNWITDPWPWYVAGPLIGLMVPVLLLIGNKSFGISSSLRHFCAACVPSGIPFFQYNWRAELWNLTFVAGIVLGGLVATLWLHGMADIPLSDAMQQRLATMGIADTTGLLPRQLGHVGTLGTLGGWLMLAGGGLLVGFGTRYAGGCTSGHSILGMSTLQWPSLVASLFFFAGGFVSTYFIVPLLLRLS